MTLSPRLEAMILEQIGEFGEMRAELRATRDDVAELKESVGELVAQDQQRRGRQNVIMAGIGAVGGLVSSGIVDLFLRLFGKN